MLISASRRTDIPTFYSEWFFNRLKEGCALARNPMNPRWVSRVSLKPDDVDGIVFWTKNPAPMLERLAELDAYQCAFQFTITPYGRDVELNVPDKREVIIPAFRTLSERFGAERVTWRYDPIFLSERYTFDYHIRAFGEICELLSGKTKRVTISFLVPYRSILASLRPLGVEYERSEQLRLAERLKTIADDCGIEIAACCDAELRERGIAPAKCVDGGLFGLNAKRDKNQRENCNCSASVDIGEYATCRHGCRYCYANHSQRQVEVKTTAHDPNSPLLSGALRDGDEVRERNSGTNG
jgi:hypothetical protein